MNAAMSVLVVDDDEALRSRLARAFKERGFDARTASSYDEAMALAREESPELAVIDLRMPGRSGLELLTDLKTLDAATRVVVLTGYGSIATAIEAMKAAEPALMRTAQQGVVHKNMASRKVSRLSQQIAKLAK